LQRRREARGLRAVPSGIPCHEHGHGEPGLQLAQQAHGLVRLLHAPRLDLCRGERPQSRRVHAVLAQRSLRQFDRPLVALADQIGRAGERIEVIDHRVERRERQGAIGALDCLIAAPAPGMGDSVPKPRERLVRVGRQRLREAALGCVAVVP